MNKTKRLIWCALLFGIQMLYTPLNRFLAGGMEFKTPIDEYIPVWSIWVIPYSLVCVWWLVAYIWAAWHMEDRLYEALFIASAVVFVSGLTIFTIFPTYIVRPTLTGEDPATQLLQWIYIHDKAYNAFPSGHVYITTLIALFWSRWFPKGRPIWIASVLIVAVSTLFTGQHYLPDPIGGLILAWVGYRIGLWCVSGQSEEKPFLKNSEKLYQ